MSTKTMRALVASGDFELAGVDENGQQKYRITAQGEEKVKMMPRPERMKVPVAITGVWLRTMGGESGPGRALEVLVEVDGKWRLLQTHWTNHSGEIGHITETGGITAAPDDYLDEPAGVEG